MYTLNQIVEKIKQVGLEHAQLRTVHAGNIPLLLRKKSDVLFPLMTIEVTSSYIQQKREYFAFDIMFLDMLNLDSVDHLQEIYSDMLSVSRDIREGLNKSMYQWKIEDGTQKEFGAPETPDVTAGVIMRLTLSQAYDASKCSPAFFDPNKIFDTQFDETYE